MSHHNNPLRALERHGVLAPPSLKKVYAERHNSSEGKERPSESKPTVHKEIAIMSNAKKIEKTETENEKKEETRAPAQVLVEAKIDPEVTTARDLKIDLNVNTPEPRKKTKLQKTGEVAERVGTIAGGVALGVLLIEGGKAAARWFSGGGDDVDPGM